VPQDHRTTFGSIDTTLVHAGEPEPRILGAVAMPVFQSAMYTSKPDTDYHDIEYIRLNNTPNHLALHAKLAAIEGAEAALVTSSGMAAITTTLLTILRSGDRLLAHRCLYGGTHSALTDDLPALGIERDPIDANRPGTWEAALHPTTRAIYVEAITNPLVEVPDLRAVVEFARAHDLVSIVDATFATPVNLRPIALGFDIVVHSATKYLNGHSDLVAGVVAGKARTIERVKRKLDHLGASLDPHAIAQLHRGLKTLALRVRAQNDNALRLAQFLAGHPAVERVRYSGLPDSPDHDRARELLSGFGGMLAFEPVGDAEAAERVVRSLRVPLEAPSLGGLETLVSIPARVSHADLGRDARDAMGIPEGLIRVSVGIEGIQDLITDFERALTS
jgi:cystathionine gamma-synthase/cystathionine gamma-lyase/cystathionine beta-lyase